MKKIIAVALSILFSVTPVYGATKEPDVAARGAVLMDGKTGRVLWGRNAEETLTMASTTKIMTAILILERGELFRPVVVGKNPSRAPEVNMDLKEGEVLLVEHLLYGLMLKSYNDAAVALAEDYSGSVDEFCKRMTEKAKEIGAVDTVFGSPNGLDSQLDIEQHHSTAKDMALIGRYALQNPDFVRIVGSPAVTIYRGKNGDTPFDIQNSNRFLSSYPGAMGIKTGYTNKAGHCFVGAAQQEDRTFITAVLGSGWGDTGKEQKWKDTRALMDYGFANFTEKQIVKPGIVAGSVPVGRSPISEVPVAFSEGASLLLSEEELERIQVEIFLLEGKEAPVVKGDVLGKALVMLDGQCLFDLKLVAVEEAQPYTLMQWYERMADEWMNFKDSMELPTGN